MTIKAERLRAFTDTVRAYFCDAVGVEERQHDLWDSQMEDLRMLLYQAYRDGIMDGLAATGLQGRQILTLYDDLVALPSGAGEQGKEG